MLVLLLIYCYDFKRNVIYSHCRCYYCYNYVHLLVLIYIYCNAYYINPYDNTTCSLQHYHIIIIDIAAVVFIVNADIYDSLK